MPAFWITEIDEQNGTVTLSDGRSISLDDIPGNGWPQARLNRLTDFANGLFETRVPQSSLDPLDEDRTLTDAELRAKYNHRAFLDGNDIVYRSVEFVFSHDGSQLRVVCKAPGPA